LKQNKFIFIVYSALFYLQFFLSPTQADVQEIKLAHNSGPDSLYEVCAQEFARRVNRRLAGAVRVTVYGQSRLGGEGQVLQKMQTGEVQLAIVSTVMSSVASEFGVFEMPFLIQDREQVKRFRPKVMEDFLIPAAASKGYLLLGMWESGFRHITSSTGPVKTPADLKNLRLRVPEGDWHAKMFRAYGSSPIPLPFDRVYARLKDKTLDADDSPLAQIYGGRFYEVQKYLTLSKHLYTPAFLIGSKTVFERMSPAIRAAFTETAAEMQDWCLQQGEKLDVEILQRMRPIMTVNEADPLAFLLVSLRIYQEYISTFPRGRALIKTIFEAEPFTLSRY
jgi:tripartite ATP-independent transporter DctP family solute receptor